MKIDQVNIQGKKILGISASYPPFHAGGYEIRIKDVFDGLSALGHQIQVLTTRPVKHSHPIKENQKYPILRKLHDRRKARFFPKEILFDLMDTRLIEKTINSFHPDLIYLGHIYNLSKAILPYLAGLNIPIILDEGGNVVKGAWTEHGRWYRFVENYQSSVIIVNKIKPLIIKIVHELSQGRLRLDWIWPPYMKIIFNSELNRSNARSFGVPVEQSVVIHSGVDLDKFSFKPRSGLSSPLRIIIPGRIEEKKGQIDGVRLVHELEKMGIKAVLILVGFPSNDVYYQLLKDEIQKYQLSDKVLFYPMVDQDELIDLYHNSDICFFPSYQIPGLSRIPLEAMACGCLVITYGNEGSAEIIENGKNGFLISTGDFKEISKIINLIFESQELIKSLIDSANRTIRYKYSLEIYVNRINKILIT